MMTNREWRKIRVKKNEHMNANAHNVLGNPLFFRQVRITDISNR